MVCKRQKHFIIADKSLARTAVCYKLHLLLRNMELFSENVSVSGCLIQHIYEVRVIKDVLNLLRRKQVLDILRDTGRHTAPFTETLPDLSRILRCLFLFQKEVELINVVASDFFLFTVCGNLFHTVSCTISIPTFLS